MQFDKLQHHLNHLSTTDSIRLFQEINEYFQKTFPKDDFLVEDFDETVRIYAENPDGRDDIDTRYDTGATLLRFIEEKGSDEIPGLQKIIDDIDKKYELTPVFSFSTLNDMPTNALIVTGATMLNVLSSPILTCSSVKVLKRGDLADLQKCFSNFLTDVFMGMRQARENGREALIDQISSIYSHLTTYLRRARKTDSDRFIISRQVVEVLDNMIATV